jgi:O-antigen ligase
MGLSPGRKLLVSFITLVLVTIPLDHVYNSISIILFVLYSILAARKEDITIRAAIVIPVFLFLIMALSLVWSIDIKSSLMALSKEASLFFIPIAFCINRRVTRKGTYTILKTYGLAMCLFGLYAIIRAFVRYNETGNIEVFYYNELATPQLSAVYLSALLSVALFAFVVAKQKTIGGYAAMLFLLILLFLLSIKSIILVDVLIVISYYAFFSMLSVKTRVTALAIFCLVASALGYYGNIYKSVVHTMQSALQDESPAGMNNVSPSDAWTKERFSEKDYFSPIAFRAYQVRICAEMIKEDNVFFTGYGINASEEKIEQKGREHNVAHLNEENIGYNKLDFHNQYAEAFADLGIFGFITVVLLMLVNLVNAIKSKYFVHIAFAVLMISLFLTESFLWRQRGVVFFTVFYCIFNDLLPLGIEKLKHEKDTHNRSGGIFGVTSL